MWESEDLLCRASGVCCKGVFTMYIMRRDSKFYSIYTCYPIMTDSSQCAYSNSVVGSKADSFSR